MGLRDKYKHAVLTAKRLRMDGTAAEKGGRLHVVGTVNTEDDKLEILNALETVPEWRDEVVADITVRPPRAHPAAGRPGGGATDVATPR